MNRLLKGQLRRTRLLRNVQKSRFCTKPKEKLHPSTPPPPPPSQSSGGFWVVLTAALVGGGFYFQEDIKGYFQRVEKGVDLPENFQPKGGDILKQDLQGVKDTIAQAEKTLESELSTKAKDISKEVKIDWTKVRESIVSLLDSDTHDDGSFGPVLVRLAWHSAGTYDKSTGKGGSEGACMRFKEEGGWGANNGLDKARKLLEKVKAQFPQVSYSDLWSFAGTVAIEEMGGPQMKWRPGRKDYKAEENPLPDGLLPDADGREDKVNVAKHVRFIFNRMGFNDQEIVALMGAHALGRCHTENSGYTGPWTFAPTTFSNEYFRLLVEEKWVPKTTENGKPWKGPEQFTDEKTGELMMLPTDMTMITDPGFKKWSEIYAKDEERFFKDFSKAWMKLQENGVKKFTWKFWPFY